MRASAIRGVPVIDSRARRAAGVVADVILDLVAGRIVALDVQHGDGLLRQRVPIDRVDCIEPGLVRVADVNEIDFIEPQPWDERCLSTMDLFGLQVLSADGEHLGRVRDALVRAEDLRVEAYELQAPIWRRTLDRAGVRIRADEVVSSSPDAMLVERTAPQRVRSRFPRLAQPAGLLRRA